MVGAWLNAIDAKIGTMQIVLIYQKGLCAINGQVGTANDVIHL